MISEESNILVVNHVRVVSRGLSVREKQNVLNVKCVRFQAELGINLSGIEEIEIPVLDGTRRRLILERDIEGLPGIRPRDGLQPIQELVVRRWIIAE